MQTNGTAKTHADSVFPFSDLYSIDVIIVTASCKAATRTRHPSSSAAEADAVYFPSDINYSPALRHRVPLVPAACLVLPRLPRPSARRAPPSPSLPEQVAAFPISAEWRPKAPLLARPYAPRVPLAAERGKNLVVARGGWIFDDRRRRRRRLWWESAFDRREANGRTIGGAEDVVVVVAGSGTSFFFSSHGRRAHETRRRGSRLLPD